MSSTGIIAQYEYHDLNEFYAAVDRLKKNRGFSHERTGSEPNGNKTSYLFYADLGQNWEIIVRFKNQLRELNPPPPVALKEAPSQQHSYVGGAGSAPYGRGLGGRIRVAKPRYKKHIVSTCRQQLKECRAHSKYLEREIASLTGRKRKRRKKKKESK